VPDLDDARESTDAEAERGGAADLDRRFFGEEVDPAV
jgi:hypothetical protein